MKAKLLFLILFSSFIKAQTLETIIKGGELLVTGISIFKTSRLTDAKTKAVDSKFVATVCVKNKLAEKIIVKLDGKDAEGTKVTKELLVQNDGKECVFEIPKGIYTYEIILTNKEIFKKGEYKFEEEITITVNND
ncbi:hypothetical protein [Flavobacterium difficile]|uniref:Uncharacterized protein n=1 Tax=Flavobacterium difficile TaxID=2709659 RepID=A0ABX0IAD8_9FLAO|nr:hypothetical protein [Flavobacterium difficile]NHM02804.1 hypothetical protein [Flavobacterium difficile]